MLAERKTDGLADTVDEGVVKNAPALARHMKEQLSDREQMSAGWNSVARVVPHLTRAEFDAMIATDIERTSTSPATCWPMPA